MKVLIQKRMNSTEKKQKLEHIPQELGGGDKCTGYQFVVEDSSLDLSIKEIPTSKDKIEQPELAADDRMFIPRLGFSVIISGKSGSGKSTLLANLFTDPRFYGPSEEKPKGWFDKIFLFSPTANGDDVQKSLNIDKKHVFTDLDEGPELLEIILNSQQKKIEKADGAHKVEQFAIIFDDIIGDTQFMNERAFTRCFYQVRHVNCTTFICTQHFNRVPRVCRLQANFIFFFQGSQSEVETIVEEFAPPQYSKNEFRQLVTEATGKNKFDFLTINMKVGWDLRFRRNLDEFIQLGRLGVQEEEEEESSDSEDEGDEGEDEGDCEDFLENTNRESYEKECNTIQTDKDYSSWLR
jgi:hypothetical protein